MNPPPEVQSHSRARTERARTGDLADRVRVSGRWQWWVLWVVLSGLLATNLLFTVFVVALADVARGLHTSVATITWVVTGPMLAFGVIAPIAGKASDLFGHKRLFLIGVVLEVAVAVASAAAPNAGVLIAARVLGGLVGATIGAASMALVLSVFDKEDRVKAMGYWSLVGAGGPVLGVAIGGPVIEYFGWRWMFVLQVPLLVMSGLLAVAVLPERASGRRVASSLRELDLDYAGAALIALCVGAFLLALNRAPLWGWSSAGVLGAFGVSALSAVAFARFESRATDPVFPLEYLRRRNFVFPIAAQATANFAYLGGFFLAPLLLEEVFGYAHDQSAVGFLVLPRPIVFSVLAPFAGYLAVRIGERGSAMLGTTSVAASMAVFALLGRGSGLALVEVALVLSGIGLGFAQPPLAATIANEFRPEDLGTASASQQLMGQVGTVAGIQVMQTVEAAAARSANGLLGAFHAAFAVGGLVSLVAVVSAFMMRSMVRGEDRSMRAAVEISEALEVGERQPVIEENRPVAGGEVEGDRHRGVEEAIP